MTGNGHYKKGDAIAIQIFRSAIGPVIVRLTFLFKNRSMLRWIPIISMN
jgi:hypothetical protein